VTGDEGIVVTKFNNKFQHGKIVSSNGPQNMSEDPPPPLAEN
jgi:hypothetical protein